MQAFEAFVREKEWGRAMASDQHNASVRRQKALAYSQQPGKPGRSPVAPHLPEQRQSAPSQGQSAWDQPMVGTAQEARPEGPGAGAQSLAGRKHVAGSRSSGAGQDCAAGSSRSARGQTKQKQGLQRRIASDGHEDKSRLQRTQPDSLWPAFEPTLEEEDTQSQAQEDGFDATLQSSLSEEGAAPASDAESDQDAVGEDSISFKRSTQRPLILCSNSCSFCHVI